MLSCAKTISCRNITKQSMFPDGQQEKFTHFSSYTFFIEHPLYTECSSTSVGITGNKIDQTSFMKFKF